MKKLALVILPLFLSLPVVMAYSFNFSTDDFKVIEEPLSFLINGGGSTGWYNYTLNTTDYIYWAGILVENSLNCTLATNIELVDSSGRVYRGGGGVGGDNGVYYVPVIFEDTSSKLDRGPYRFNLTFETQFCKSSAGKVVGKKLVFLTSKKPVEGFPMFPVPPDRCPEKEPKIRAFGFANKTYWREFELNLTYFYGGDFAEIVSGWNEEPCPILSIDNGSICLPEEYCGCYTENVSLKPGIYHVSLRLKEGNLSAEIRGDEVVFRKSVRLEHPLYLSSVGTPCSNGIIGNVSFYGVEGSPSEMFHASENRYGAFIFAVALLIGGIVSLMLKR